MMRQFELLERVQAYNPDADEALLNKAYVYAMQKHGMQRRASGDPYFAHPLEVAAILTDLKLDDATIAVGLLHDTIEDTDATRAEIDKQFGKEIGSIVDGLTKIDRLNLVSREEAQAENLRKLLLAIAQDVRVLIVKLADRLHNMRTLSSLNPEQRQRIAQETMEIYAPLAGRMGMQEMRTELEDLAFQTLQPDHFQAITERLEEVRRQSARPVARIRADLRKYLKSKGIKAEVIARFKRAYSIFRKMERKAVGLEQLSDIIGFRIIVETVDDCYRALGVVHERWSYVPGRFKDYISTPKQNDYRSLHTTIVGPGRQRVELQIRTQEMNQIAEFGIAAHALYKDGVSGDMKRLESESRAYGWLRSTIAQLTKGDNPDEFLEHTKLELFQDQVFCFTPRGRLIALPRGATPIDFAYAVHTEIGDTCVGAKINGTVMPLITVLRNGDEVEVIRDPSHVPPPSWEGIAITGRARSAIRRAVREAAIKRAYALGEQLYLGAIERESVSLTQGDLDRLLAVFGLASRRDLMVALGEGDIDTERLSREIGTIKGKKVAKRKPLANMPAGTSAEGWFSLRNSSDFKFRIPGGQRLSQGANAPRASLAVNTPVRISPEGVVPGDRLVGIFDEDRLLTIYPIDSEALAEQHEGKAMWLDVRWDLKDGDESAHRAVVAMQSVNKPGQLAQVSAAIASCEANIQNLLVRAISPDFHAMLFELELRDLAQLTDVLSTLKRTPGLTRVHRASYAESAALESVAGGADFAAPAHYERQE